MLNNEAQAATAVKLLDPISAAATANATSGWVDVRDREGDLMVTVQVGALSGTITWTIEDATDGSGTGAAGVTPTEGAFIAGAANQLQKRTVGAGAVRGWVRVVGTIVTGPVLVSANVASRPKIV